MISHVNAATLQFDLNNEFSGADTPSGTPIATIDNDDSLSNGGLLNDATNSVLLRMDINDLSGGEGILKWFFNFDQTDAENLSFTHVSGAAASYFQAGSNCSGQNCKADGDGTNDWVFFFDKDVFSIDGTYTSSVYEIS